MSDVEDREILLCTYEVMRPQYISHKLSFEFTQFPIFKRRILRTNLLSLVSIVPMKNVSLSATIELQK